MGTMGSPVKNPVQNHSQPGENEAKVVPDGAEDDVGGIAGATFARITIAHHGAAKAVAMRDYDPTWTAPGHERPKRNVRVESVRFSTADIGWRGPKVALCPTAAVGQRQSITSSARAMRVGGTSRPSALAVLRLMTSSILVGRSIGRSCGFAPFRILST
jgi:hypothetical protein